MINQLFTFKRLFSLLFLTMLSSVSAGLWAQVDAQFLLKQRLKKLSTFQAEFSQTVTDAQQTVLQEASGQITLQYPNKLYWRIDEPNENILVADGQTLWQLDPFMEQVVAVNQAAAVNNNPLILLTNPQGEAWNSFDVAEHNNQFSITPKDPQGEVAKLVLSFTEDRLTAMQIIDSQQQVSALQFSHIRQNEAVDKKVFEFSVPSGYELDDQRNP